MRKQEIELLILFVSMLLCAAERFWLVNISSDFFQSYFVDVFGSVALAAYCNYIISYSRKWDFHSLWKIELLMLCCGIIWEYVVPLFRKNSVSDVWDIVAYCFGGLVYWIIAKMFGLKKSKQL